MQLISKSAESIRMAGFRETARGYECMQDTKSCSVRDAGLLDGLFQSYWFIHRSEAINKFRHLRNG